MLVAVLLATALAGCVDDAPAPGDPVTPSWALRCEPCGQTIAMEGLWPSEVDLAVNPSDPEHWALLTAAFEGGLPESPYQVFGDTERGHRWLWLATTRDGGSTWSLSRVPGGPTEGADHPLAGGTAAADPSVGILEDGTIVINGFTIIPGYLESPAGAGVFVDRRDLFVMRTSDDGATWSDPVILSTAIANALVFAGGVGGGVWDTADKNMIAAGRGEHGDTVLTAWTQIQAGISGSGWDTFVAVSRDGGATFGEPVRFSDGYGVSPAVLSDGTLAVAVTEPVDGESVTSVFESPDGATWTRTGIAPGAYLGSYPHLRPGPNGTAVLAHSIPQEPGRYPAVTLRDENGTWGAPMRLAAAQAPAPMQSAAIDAAGMGYAAWHGPDDGRPMQFTAWARGGGNGTATAPGATTGHWSYHYRASAGLPEGAVHVWMTGGPDPMGLSFAVTRLVQDPGRDTA